jgi:hypothetical protein
MPKVEIFQWRKFTQSGHPVSELLDVHEEVHEENLGRWGFCVCFLNILLCV